MTAEVRTPKLLTGASAFSRPPSHALPWSSVQNM